MHHIEHQKHEWSTTELRARGARVTGFDISWTRLAEARRHLLATAGSQPVWPVLCAGEALPFADALLEAPTSKNAVLTRARHWLQMVDRKLVDTIPFIGRYCWETVIILNRR